MSANLAEAPQFEDPVLQEFEAPHLYLVKDPAGQEPDETGLGRFVNADSIPELSIERQRVAQNAAKILGQNRHLLHNGGAENVPTPIEILGTARRAVEVKQKYGTESSEYKERWEGLVLDSERLIGEASSRNKSEYFARKPQVFQPETREYFSHGMSVSEMIKNGLSPTAELEEQPRRINETVEEDGTYVPIGSMIADLGLRRMVERLQIPIERELLKVSVEVTTISECTDSAIEDHEINPKGSHSGYRPAMKGIAIRRVHFEDDSGDREEEQAIISGIYITPELIREVLAEKGAINHDQELTKTELHGSQFLSINDGSIVGFIQELDERASEAHDKNIFMGEEVPADHPKDYDEFIEQAEERRKQLAPLPVQLAELLVSLEEEGIDNQTAEDLTNQFLKDKLLTRAKERPELAEIMFDEATAEGFAEVSRLEAQGRVNEAWLLELEVREEAPDPSYCGATNRKNNTEKDATSFPDGEDKYGSLKFKCPNGHINTRKKNELIDECQVCGTSVTC